MCIMFYFYSFSFFYFIFIYLIIFIYLLSFIYFIFIFYLNICLFVFLYLFICFFKIQSSWHWQFGIFPIFLKQYQLYMAIGLLARGLSFLFKILIIYLNRKTILFNLQGSFGGLDSIQESLESRFLLKGFCLFIFLSDFKKLSLIKT
ncbi:transmembrane protein, putative (macronuclear) [Tetrahymena thermophila SB210]|uniref:Transmembrane protein, putative n=1 Tax=Tetrahymena thermophila (strain SB210) TaxID=312017 RepID=W7X8S6_TETTS|nr:transmembrane protein, putative [Tetrahymena thermophila SB210]EWS73762.1 transmembrane protein, putative [Tetrahymena thermophila SB210]|eukprot:XP_012653726.1 transmembrane protein, putative [Tetrahymena thermophila SB210]